MWVFVCSVNFSLFSSYHAEGYHARTDTFKLTGYHVCRVTTPELPRSIQTSGYRRVITPAGSYWLFLFPSANTSVLPQQRQLSHRAWRTPHGRTQHAFSHRAWRTPHGPTQQERRGSGSRFSSNAEMFDTTNNQGCLLYTSPSPRD